MAKPGDSPVMDGSSQTPPPNTFSIGIELLGGVSDVTIRGLEIRDYAGGFADPEDDRRSNPIRANAGTTSDITVHYNYIHDNRGNGMTVGGAGSNNWKIEHNFIIDNINNGINFSVSESEIKDNFLRGNGGGLSVGARNRAGAGNVTVSDVVIKRNEVSHDLEGSGINLNA